MTTSISTKVRPVRLVPRKLAGEGSLESILGSSTGLDGRFPSLSRKGHATGATRPIVLLGNQLPMIGMGRQDPARQRSTPGVAPATLALR